jgi:Protein of unknown function (DUF2971)
MTDQSPPIMFLEKLERHGIKPLRPFGSYIFKYTSFESAVKIIQNNTLYFSKPLEFNDPFEMTNSLIDTSYTKNDLRIWLNSLPDLSNNQRKQLLKDYHNKKEVIAQAIERSFNQLKSSTGVCCFSKCYKKTLMWSHYAENHSGVCLGFDISPLNPNEFFLLLVNYIDKIVPLNYFRDIEAILFYWIYSKSKIWEYEDEVRAVYTNQNGLIPFDKNCLKEVFFGLRTEENNRTQFIAMLNDLGYSLDKISVMDMDLATFDLKEKRIF